MKAKVPAGASELPFPFRRALATAEITLKTTAPIDQARSQLKVIWLVDAFHSTAATAPTPNQ